MTTASDIGKDPIDPIQACLLMDDPQALHCLEELIENWPGGQACKPSLVLLTRGNCLPCEEEHEVHAAAIAAGIMEVVEIDSPRGADIAARNGIEMSPTVLLLDCMDTVIEQDGEIDLGVESTPIAQRLNLEEGSDDANRSS